jgi:hypothetical protein
MLVRPNLLVSYSDKYLIKVVSTIPRNYSSRRYRILALYLPVDLPVVVKMKFPLDFSASSL